MVVPGAHLDMSEDLAPLACWLCGRPLGRIVEWHHPVPKSKKGKLTVPVHPICHKMIHANFSNSALARIGDDPGVIRSDPATARFLAWIANKPADFNAPTR
jgi:hypothetical protein